MSFRFLNGKVVQDFLGGMHDNVTYRTGPGYQPARENWLVKAFIIFYSRMSIKF